MIEQTANSALYWHRNGSGALLSADGRYFVTRQHNQSADAHRRQLPQAVYLGHFANEIDAQQACERDARLCG